MFLDDARTGKLKNIDKVDHSYDDKYLMCNFLTNIALASTYNSLVQLGLEEAQWNTLLDWNQERKFSVSIRFTGVQSCKFIEERIRDVESSKLQTVTQKNVETTSATKVITTVKEYAFEYTTSCELICYAGVGSKDGTIIKVLSHMSSFEVVCRSRRSP